MLKILARYREQRLNGKKGEALGQERFFNQYRHTLGSIIWMALLRLVITIFASWYLKDQIADYSQWWLLTALAIYGVAIYPAQIQYEYFKKENRRLIEGTLCSSCRHFRPENLHCTRLDEHISEHHLPCEGEEWEPKNFDFS